MADARYGPIFGDLDKWVASPGWVTAVAVPVLTVAYMLGIMIMTATELFETRILRFLHFVDEMGNYLYIEQDVFDAISKNGMLLKQFEDVARYRRILLGSIFPLAVLAVGLF